MKGTDLYLSIDVPAHLLREVLATELKLDLNYVWVSDDIENVGRDESRKLLVIRRIYSGDLKLRLELYWKERLDIDGHQVLASLCRALNCKGLMDGFKDNPESWTLYDPFGRSSRVDIDEDAVHEKGEINISKVSE